MTYAITKLKTKEQCDELSTDVQKQKDQYSLEKTALLLRQNNSSGTNAEVTNKLISTRLELAGITNIVDSLSDGDTKDEYLRKQAALTHHLRVLEGKEDNHGAVAQLKRAFELANIESFLTEADSFLDAIAKHKDTLTV